ncbi:MAG: cupin domain-containing protein [Sphingomonadales bacterium]|nr:cupin domain-containing protein [Sphingomonadales bacterium]
MSDSKPKPAVRPRNWNELDRETVRPGVSRAGFRGDDVMLVMNWLQPGMETRPHSHPCEQIVYVVKGRMRFVIADEEIEVGAGGLVRIPPGVMHYGEPIGDEEVLNLDVFAPLREDYRHLVAYQDDEF